MHTPSWLLMGTLRQALSSFPCPSLAYVSPPSLPQRRLLGMKTVEWVAGVPPGFRRIYFLRGIDHSLQEEHAQAPPKNAVR